MHDRFRKRFQVPQAGTRQRRQIALEAARRIHETIGPGEQELADWLRDSTESDYYTAKRKAAAVLGHRVRPGDLPSDAEVREQVVILARSRPGPGSGPGEGESDDEAENGDGTEPDDAVEPEALALADHVDRFSIYRMRLEPLQSVKQNARHHPEGDALYHSLQVFELAREVRPYDEEFLLAALLHDVGKAIDPQDHAAAGAESLRGAVTERTLWLIEHHMDMLALRERTLNTRVRRLIEASEFFDDLKLLRDLDDAGRVPGAPVGAIEQVLAYLRGLEEEAYLDP